MRERVQLIEIRFAYSKPEYAEEYKPIFNCPILFDAEETQIRFDSSYLTRPLPCANTLTKKIYEKDCRQTLEQLIMLTTTTELAKSALQFKDKELLTRSQLARCLNMSDQTLKRRLAAEGVSYKSLVKDIRQKKACDLLQSTELTMEEIANKVGYRDVANFYRAFKSWTGLTPRSCRGKNEKGNHQWMNFSFAEAIIRRCLRRMPMRRTGCLIAEIFWFNRRTTINQRKNR